MKNIKQFRAEHPEYSDLDDATLANALHSKYYSDVNRGEFMSKFVHGDGEPTPEDLTPQWAGEYPNLYGVAGAAREMLGPVLSAAGLVGGGMVGGASTGPAAPAGAVAGAGLGYGMAENVLRQADVALGNRKPYDNLIEAGQQTGRDVATGATYEMGGQVIGSAIQPAVRFIAPAMQRFPGIGRPFKGRGMPGTAGRAQVEAGEQLLDAQPKTLDDLINSGRTEMETTMSLERAGAPRLTEAQLTGNKQLSLIEQAQAKAGGGTDFAGKLLRENEAAVLAARNEVENVVAGGQVVPISKDELGAVVRESLKTKHRASYDTVKTAYDAIPASVTIGKGKVGKEVNVIIKQMVADGEVGLMTPAGQKVLQLVDDVLVKGGETISLTRLSNLRRQVSDVASEAYSGGNKTTWNFLRQFRDKIDDIIELGEGIPPKYAQASADAREAFKAHKKLYESGKVADVIGTGKEFGGAKIAEEAIPSKFFSSGSITSAKQLIEVVGKEEAKKLAVESGKAEAVRVMQSATEPKTLMNWLNQNQRVFDIYGIKPSEVLDRGMVKDLIVGKYKDPTLNQLATRLKQIGSANLKQIFNPKEVQALRDYHTILKAVQRNQNVTAGGGPTTAEALTMGQSKKLGGIFSALAQLGALQAGKGFMYQASKNIMKGLYQLGIENPQTVGQLLEEAAYSPALAKTLMDVAKKAGTKGISQVEVAAYRRSLQGYVESGYLSPVQKTLQRPKAMYGAPPAMSFGYDDLIRKAINPPTGDR